uniref:Uncharacterized protein n=1 Tax=Stomoxys calcitrans TaxID=35570 RepID=A0A1I8PPS8_STOCA
MGRVHRELSHSRVGLAGQLNRVSKLRNFGTFLNHLLISESASADDITSVNSKYDVAYKAYVQAMSTINGKVDQLRSRPKSHSPLNQSFNQTITPRANSSHREDAVFGFDVS